VQGIGGAVLRLAGWFRGPPLERPHRHTYGGYQRSTNCGECTSPQAHLAILTRTLFVHTNYRPPYRGPWLLGQNADHSYSIIGQVPLTVGHGNAIGRYLTSSVTVTVTAKPLPRPRTRQCCSLLVPARYLQTLAAGQRILS